MGCNKELEQAELRESALLRNIRNDVVGESKVFNGPYGTRKCLYLDQTASGKPVNSIEQFISSNVLPVYANTHSSSAFCASQITRYREEARSIIEESCGCSENDVVIFCGSGSTTAVHKLAHCLMVKGGLAPYVIIGPYEHHSNILPWRAVAKKVISVSEDDSGSLNLRHLEQILRALQKKVLFQKRLIIGSFSACSNVTGALTDTLAVTVLMHRYGGLALFDYSASAPHDEIQMNPKTGSKHFDKLAEKDAIFFSGHKFLGGPQTTGVLVAKKSIFRNPLPQCGGGGGTVHFVTQNHHAFLDEIEEKEEAGTPNIVGAIRLGLVFRLKSIIGSRLIVAKEDLFTRKALKAWTSVEQIRILGCSTVPRAPIISFLIHNPQTNLYLHHDFVVRLLNDLFGIQCRGGCMCAGPYAQGLLGISDSLAEKYERILSQKTPDSEGHLNYPLIFKPGFIRITLPFHASVEEIDFAIDAVSFIAKSGWKLLPLYAMNLHEGTFRFSGAGQMNEIVSNPLRSFNFPQESDEKETCASYAEKEILLGPQECLQFAQELASSMHLIISTLPISNDTKEIRNTWKPFRWFMLSSEAVKLIRNPSHPWPQRRCPFTPKTEYKTDISPKSQVASHQHQFPVRKELHYWADKYTLKYDSSESLIEIPVDSSSSGGDKDKGILSRAKSLLSLASLQKTSINLN